MKNIKKNGGFTLVELIVVIAILAILAAVAIPAYSGYIEKAKIAGDETLLRAVNEAFAAACVQNGSDIWLEKAATAVLENGSVKKIAPYTEDFAIFFAGNENAKFEVFTGLHFIPTLGRFISNVDLANGSYGDVSITSSYKGGVITMTGSQISSLQNSTYLQNMTTTDLLNQVNDVSDMASQFSDGGYAAISQSPEFIKFFADTMGVKPEDFNAKAQEMAKQSLLNKGYTEAEITGTLMQGEIDKFKANAMVLYTAQNSASLDATSALNLLSGKTAADISANMNSADVSTNTQGLTQAALAYGLYYAYVNSDACTDSELKGKTDIGIVDVTAGLENEEFKKYLESSQGKKDIEGYLSAMQMISSSANSDGNEVAVESLITNGYNNQELLDVMNGINTK